MCFVAGASSAKLPMCDLRNMRDPQQVVDVVTSCLQNMLAIEKQTMPSVRCLTALQTEVNERMRQIMIGWLVEVHLKFKLMPETLFIAVNLVDRMTERVVIKRSEY
jgi:hypothetical protein